MIPSILCSFVSYILCGGLEYTLKAAFGLGKTMWYLIPTFPADIFLGLTGVILGIIFLLFVPFFFAIKGVKRRIAIREEAALEATLEAEYAVA